ncbi:lysosomal-associated transmembrane protein 4A isoform X2 [Centruroides vittatus]
MNSSDKNIPREKFRCCFCCHVRTGTIILGTWHLLLHILALGLLFGIMFHPEAISSQISSTSISDSSTALPDLRKSSSDNVFTSDIYSPQLHELIGAPAANYAFGKENWQVEDVQVGIVITTCTGALTVLLLLGVIKGIPNFLMPFFCLQIFDFIISALTAVGYFSYVPDVQKMIQNAPDLPFRKLLLCMDPQWLLALMMIIVILCMMLKVYFMNIVWSCHKYLKLQQQLASSVDAYLETDVEALLPPDYITATKMPPHIPVYIPPSYTAASNNQS